MMLHKFSDSPFHTQTLLNRLKRIGEKDSVLLIEDAVYALQDPALLATLGQQCHQVYALIDDVLARGLLRNQLSVAYIDYDEFVDLTLATEKTIAW